MSDLKAPTKEVVGGKKGHREYRRRTTALPVEYRQVSQEIEKYAWHFSDHDGTNMFNVLTDLLDLFEEGAANGTPIKNITGEKVGDFAGTIINEVAGKRADRQKEKLGHQFSKQQSKQKEESKHG